MDRKYQIYLEGNLSKEENTVYGKFCIKTNQDEIKVKIGVSRDFLKSWKLNRECDYGNAVSILGFLMAELMFLKNNVRDYIFIFNEYPQNFQDEENGFNLLINFLKTEIAMNVASD